MRLIPPLITSAFFATVVTCFSLPVTVDWPAGTSGSYRLQGFAEKGATEKQTFEIPDGSMVRFTGPGFDFAFRTEKGRVIFPHPPLWSKMGVRWNPKTSTFSFQTASVTLAVTDCDLAVNWRALTAKPEAEESGANTRTYTVPFGRHSLKYADTTLPFTVDQRGVVSLDHPVKGIAVEPSKIIVTGLPYVVKANAPGWSIQKTTATSKGEAERTVHLLPKDDAYVFLSAGKTSSPANFYIGQDGLLSTQPEGPFTELLTLTAQDGTTLGTISLPNGEALAKARADQEAIEKEQRGKVLAASETAKWKHDFSFKDAMNFRDFPDELISYSVSLPPDVNPSELVLLRFDENTVRTVPFQIERKSDASDATISFRSDLPKLGQRLFRLARGFDASDVPVLTLEPPKLTEAGSHEATFSNSQIAIKVPAGRQDFAPAKALSEVPAPILAVSRGGGVPALTGGFTSTAPLPVKSLEAKLTASGPLFARYEMVYTLEGDKKYTVTLELRAGESEVAVAESFTGFTPEDNASLKLDYSQGLNPNRRLVASNGGYEAYSGDYAKDAGLDGRLNFQMSLYCANSLGIARAVAFYNEQGDDALLLAINRPRDWVTSRRAVWSSGGLPENFHFYAANSDKFLTAGLAGSKRHWVLGLVPRSETALSVPPGVRAPGVGPEVRLLNRLGEWSLDKYKGRLAAWEEKLVAAPFDDPKFNVGGGFTAQPYDDYAAKLFDTKTFFQWLRNVSWDFSSEVGPVSFRDMPRIFGQYAASRANWTPEQRERVRQLLLFLADSSEDDANLPHHSMLGGHPNFIMDVKAVLPVAAATFPNHPKAKFWRDSFMDYYQEWLDKYARKDVPELNTLGGRWTENIACYVGQCFTALLDSQHALQAYDGTTLGQNPQLIALVRWMRNSFMSPQDGVRLIPPEGAHARGFEPGYGNFRETFFLFCAALAKDDPQLAAEMRWIETNGKEGTKPDIKSALFTDYGPVMHHDFGGPHESYAHMQLLNGMGYRWGQAGIVYYGAKDKVWSYNNEETNGDEFRWNAVSGFNVRGKGLSPRPVDQLLYDFGAVQFYRQPGLEGDDYRARGMMLVRDDYLVLSDEVASPEIAGTFNWVNVFDLPQIYQLKPGAPAVESTSHDKLPRKPSMKPDRTGNIRSYTGKGDFLTVIAPAAVTAEAKPFGATVNGDHVFCSGTALKVAEKDVVFEGTYGYARPGELDLFQGTRIGLGGFEIQREGGDFGVSAVADKKRISGRLVGFAGGKVHLTPPRGLNPAGATVSIDGHPVSATVERGAVVFPVEIAQRDGIKNYEVTFP